LILRWVCSEATAQLESVFRHVLHRLGPRRQATPPPLTVLPEVSRPAR
jgi:hypothetical protein